TCTTRRREASYTASHLRVMRQCTTPSRTRENVASYSAGQVTGTVLLTRVLGYRVPVTALAVGASINAVTHLVIDKRQPLLWLAAKAGKGGYVEHCTVVRRLDEDATAHVEASGPGTAAFELDQALHRAIGAVAAVTTAWLTIRALRKVRAA
ncbi:hypothetical protein ACWDYG_23785, partial [Streptomyces olivaceus]